MHPGQTWPSEEDDDEAMAKDDKVEDERKTRASAGTAVSGRGEVVSGRARRTRPTRGDIIVRVVQR